MDNAKAAAEPPRRRFTFGDMHPSLRPPNVGEEDVWYPRGRGHLGPKGYHYEWIGIELFPPPTRTKYLESLQTLHDKGRDSLTILVMGKGGVGKSSTVNSIFGQPVIPVPSNFKSPVMAYRKRLGFRLNIIDTPGIVEQGCVNYQALRDIKSFLSRFLWNKTIDVFLYVDRLDSDRVDDLDRQIVKAITESFGKEIWSKGVLALTHAQLTPPDGLTYDEFYERRSKDVLKVVHSGARFKKHEMRDHAIPVVLAENSSRLKQCNRNDSGEEILPDGTVWTPNIFKTITNIATNKRKSILVDQKLIHGLNTKIKVFCFFHLSIPGKAGQNGLGSR